MNFWANPPRSGIVVGNVKGNDDFHLFLLTLADRIGRRNKNIKNNEEGE